MKNVLLYYYKLQPETIHQKNKDFRFEVNQVSYLFKRLTEVNDALYELYDLNVYLLQNNVFFHQMILNFEKNLVTYVNGTPYILLKLFVPSRELKMDDIYFFSRVNIDASKFKKLKRNNWYNLWSNNVDYIEYQNSQFGKKYPIIRESINYFIGMAENGISLLAGVGEQNSYLTISHKRIRYRDKLFDLYDPLDIVIDSRIRDLSEYYKEKFFANEFSLEELENAILSYKINSSEATMLMARMLYPSYYFDCYQEIIFGYLEEKELIKYIDKSEEYQEMLKNLYFFLKQYYTVPEIDWIIKT